MLLLIPGPVTTDPAVRAAMAQDYAPWDHDFRATVRWVRERVLHLAGGVAGVHSALPLQGCGHFAIEAALRTFVPVGGKVLVPMTGAYADRAVRLAHECGRVPVGMAVESGARVAADALAAALEADPSIGHVTLVYSETGTGICHDVPMLATRIALLGRRVLVDAVSALGALPFSLAELPAVDAVVFTSNKCVEGPPGLAFAIARIDRLQASIGQAQSWSLDLADVFTHGQRSPGSFRFTPPAPVLAAFKVALELHEAQGGQPARLARYTQNMATLYDGVRDLGLTPYLSRAVQGPIVVNVHAPDHPSWDLQRFVDALKTRGVLISNFFNTEAPSFRVGCIGAISPAQMRGAVAAMGEALDELGIRQSKAA